VVPKHIQRWAQPRPGEVSENLSLDVYWGCQSGQLSALGYFRYSNITSHDWKPIHKIQNRLEITQHLKLHSFTLSALPAVRLKAVPFYSIQTTKKKKEITKKIKINKNHMNFDHQKIIWPSLTCTWLHVPLD